MKAMILAGGSGTRLRPMTAELPKPMISLLGRPVLEHLLLQLRRHGITEVGITLHYLPQTIEAYFGDGSPWGMQLHYFTEDTPLGTAGSIRAAAEFLRQEADFLVLSGDCVCDFDLNALVQFHREQHAAVTLALCRSNHPLEYGLVQTDSNGHIQRFIEKPGWGQVFTNQVNTGIYVLSSAVLEEIPAGERYDFSRDLFPKLLEKNQLLCGVQPYGCWRDIGDSRSYLAAVRDVLEGKAKLDLGLPQQKGGIWSAQSIPEDVTVIPPCWIGNDVQLGKHSLIGPNVVLETNVTVGERCVIQGSVLMSGATLGSGSTAVRSILCPCASTGHDTVLNDHTVLGSSAVVEENVILRSGVRIWPGLRIAAGARLNTSVTTGSGSGQLRFDDDHVITGTVGIDPDPELMLTLGSLLAECGKVALGCCGGSGADALLLAASAGVAAAGGTAVLHDGSTVECAAWLSRFYGVPMSLFIEQSGETLRIHIFDRDGLHLSRSRQRRLENDLLRRAVHRATAGRVGGQEQITGADRAYLNDAIGCSGGGLLQPFSVCVPQTTGANRLLVQALSELGCQVWQEERLGMVLLSSAGGVLSGRDESGTALSGEQLQLMTLMLLYEGGQRECALPSSSPGAAERIAEVCGGKLYRLGRDGTKAFEVYGQNLALRDTIFSACLLCRHIGVQGEPLSRLARRVPACVLRHNEVPLSGERAQLMQAVHRLYPEAENMGEGLRIHLDNGSVWIAPKSTASALRIAAEGTSTEAASELCEFISRQVQEMDSL